MSPCRTCVFPGSGAVTRAWDDYRAARVALRNGRGVQGSPFAAEDSPHDRER